MAVMVTMMPFKKALTLSEETLIVPVKAPSLPAEAVRLSEVALRLHKRQ